MRTQPAKNKQQKNGHPLLTFQRTIGQKTADMLTSFVGSWFFIIGTLLLLLVWIYLNVQAMRHHWDPYPFILLNFVLSCMAALQAPIILMSEKRHAQRDRQQARYDYEVNRKALREIEVIKKEVRSIKRLLKK